MLFVVGMYSCLRKILENCQNFGKGTDAEILKYILKIGAIFKPMYLRNFFPTLPSSLGKYGNFGGVFQKIMSNRVKSGI